jgi:hypothetical protein
MALQFKVNVAVISAIATLVVALLTQLATQNPSDAALLGAITAAISSGVQYFEEQTPSTPAPAATTS